MKLKQDSGQLLNRSLELKDNMRKAIFMKRNIGICGLLAMCLLTGCSKAEALAPEQFSAAETTTASTAAVQPGTTVSALTTAAATAAVTDEPEPVTSAAVTEAAAEQPETVPPAAEPEPEQAPPVPDTETFTGILMDECCSDVDDPSAHDLPCMLMDTCRASGYGLDIQQPDGSWRFVPFDENGQNLAWEYLHHTTRMDNLFVTVKGTLTDGVISVFDLEKVP